MNLSSYFRWAAGAGMIIQAVFAPAMAAQNDGTIFPQDLGTCYNYTYGGTRVRDGWQAVNLEDCKKAQQDISSNPNNRSLLVFYFSNARDPKVSKGQLPKITWCSINNSNNDFLPQIKAWLEKYGLDKGPCGLK